MTKNNKKKEPKHADYELAQMQSLSLEAKIRMSQYRIREWYEKYDGNVIVYRSGGKDSDVLGHLVKEMYPDVKQVFCNTGLELKQVREHALNVSDVVLTPEKSFLQIITEYGYPVISKEVSQAVYEVQKARFNNKPEPEYRMEKFRGEKKNSDGTKSAYNMEKYAFLLEAPFRISHYCCIASKKKPSEKYEKSEGVKPFIGTLADESRLRKSDWIINGCNAYDEKRPKSRPLSFWTEQDILKYIKMYDIPIAEDYGQILYRDKNGFMYENTWDDTMKLVLTGATRTGCAYCMFGITQDTDRFIRLKEKSPDLYDYIMRGGKFDNTGMWVPHNGLGYRFIIEWLNKHGDLNIL